ncbi:hypothetical protein [Alteraurantiacibacter buctensis]|uniref:Uncharacterized protein n=1 Tax=Alteraurantiacibacter buctensis TaxID=1503981 RepID=A0A844Z169_9SPHN|nr:hypothetical protein [Alteraurantiacibacter buctensis]MXO72996.1 hypothetical protein [Alteraurantiacibacter buctensis]
MRMPFPGPADLTLYRTKGSAETGAFLRYREGTGFALFGELALQREAIDGEFRAAGLPAPCWGEGDGEQFITVTASSPLPWVLSV